MARLKVKHPLHPLHKEASKVLKIYTGSNRNYPIVVSGLSNIKGEKKTIFADILRGALSRKSGMGPKVNKRLTDKRLQIKSKVVIYARNDIRRMHIAQYLAKSKPLFDIKVSTPKENITENVVQQLGITRAKQQA